MKLVLTDASNNRKVFRVAGDGHFLNPFIKLQSLGAGTAALGDVKITSGSYNTPGEVVKLSRGDSDPRPSFGYTVTRTSINTPIPTPITTAETFSADTTLDFVDNNTPFVVKNNGDSGTWTPTDLGTSVCAAWFSADSLSSLSNGDAVTSWTSSEGNSVAATQGTATAQPTYVQTSSVSGKPAVNFDGASNFDKLEFTKSTLNVGTTGSLMCCFVGNANDGTTLSFGGITRGQSGSTSIQLLYQNNNAALQVSLGSTSKVVTDSNFPSGTTGSAYRSIAFGRQDGKFALRYLGNELSDQAANSTDLSETIYNIGSSFFSGGCEGEIAEIMFLVNPTLTQIKQVEGYVAHKYSLTGSLPANHPYKYVSPTKGNDFFIGDSSVSSSNGYKLSPGERIPKSFSNIRVAKVAASSSCTASIIST